MTTSWLRRYGFAFLAWLVVMPALVTIAAPAPAGASGGAAVTAAPAAPTGETSDDAAAAEDAATAEACALERALAALEELFYRPAPRISPDHRILQYVELETWLAIDPTAWVEQQATESCTVTRQTETEGEDGETETQTTETTLSVTALATPAATIWKFTDGVTVRCEGPGVEYTPGAAGPAECGRYFENTTLVTPVAFAVHIEYDVQWQSSAGSSGELTMDGEPLDQYRLTVGEIQTFLTDVSSPRPGLPPGHNPIDSNQPIDDSDCHWTQPWNCRDEFIDAGGEILDDLVPQWVQDLIDEVIAFLTGCAEFAGEAIAGIGDIISQLRQLFTDPEAFRDEKLEVAKALYEGFKEDPEGFATEVLVQFLDLETLEEDPARWAGKVVCEVAVGILTGGAVSSISTRILNRLDDFKDAVRRWRRNRDDNDGDNNGPCRTSFPTGTLVTMADGTSRRIETVGAGQVVLAADPVSGRWHAREVLDQWSYLDTDEMATLTLTDGSQVSATDHHGFWVDNQGQWMELEDVQPGDSLLTPGGVTTVASVDVWPSAPTLVWELTVAVDHTFTVVAGDNAILVHNQCQNRNEIGTRDEVADRLEREGLGDIDPDDVGDAFENYTGDWDADRWLDAYMRIRRNNRSGSAFEQAVLRELGDGKTNGRVLNDIDGNPSFKPDGIVSDGPPPHWIEAKNLDASVLRPSSNAGEMVQNLLDRVDAGEVPGKLTLAISDTTRISPRMQDLIARAQDAGVVVETLVCNPRCGP